MTRRLGEATAKVGGAPIYFYAVDASYLFPPGVNVRVINGTAYAVQNGNAWLTVIAPKLILTAADATASLVDQAQFTAGYDVVTAQDAEPVPVEQVPVEEAPA